jgi:hypothetical protein
MPDVNNRILPAIFRSEIRDPRLGTSLENRLGPREVDFQHGRKNCGITIGRVRIQKRFWLEKFGDDRKRLSRDWASSFSAGDHDLGGKVGLARFLGYRALRPSRWARLMTERRDVPSREAVGVGPKMG